MTRENQEELLDGLGIPAELAKRTFHDIAVIHRLLGDIRCIRRAICDDALPVRRVLDVGCGTGLVLDDLRRKLGVEVVGVDLNPRPAIASPVPIYRADACCDRLPRADVAFCMYLGHHLSEADLVRLIRNVAGSCRRFILLDLVRHRLPLTLFQCLMTHFVSPITAVDGQRSIRRSDTPAEFREITLRALADIGGTFRHSVAPLYARQVIDIDYEPFLHDRVATGNHS